MNSPSSERQSDNRDVLDDRVYNVVSRVATLEGMMKEMATKSDVANAKVSMLTMWFTLGAIIVMAAINAVVRFLL